MKQPRTFDQHYELYAVFVAAVSSFDEATWARVRARCAGFNENSVFEMFERASLMARPHGYPTGNIPADASLQFQIPVKVMAGALNVFQTGMFFALELSQQIPALRDDPPKPRRKSTGNLRTDRFVDIEYALGTALAGVAEPAAGVRAAVRAAGRAVQMHDFLSADDFARSYFAIAPEISFAELEARATMV